MFKKLLGVLVALFVINTMVQTDAILNLQNQVANTKDLSSEDSIISSQNMQAAVSKSSVKQSPNIIEDVDDYLKVKYPKDYNEKRMGIMDKITKLVPDSDIGSNEDETTEIRRFLCWVTGGIWVQIGPAKMCQYARETHYTPGEERLFDQSDTDVGMFNVINKIITSEKSFNDLYFTNKGLSRDEVYLEIEKIFLSGGINKSAQHLNIRKFFCRLFGGDWLDEQTVSIETEHGTVTSTFSSCTY